MTRQAFYTPPRRPALARAPLDIAMANATKFTSKELQGIMEPVIQAHKHLREGVATEMDWCVLASSINIALQIESQGVVRGLAEHLHSAEKALQTIAQRASITGTWIPTALYYQELDAVSTGVELYQYQCEQLSAAEFKRAINAAVGEIRSTGGRVITTLN
ncbi:hypothetical protein [Limnohabitans sp.]|uniref:hypothetical protein n=1 Tax=Limnohabitans sp. TaxID=1907725 RepID=UPI00286F7106|nr:hypothetical protein [Limnohabitans sp.]